MKENITIRELSPEDEGVENGVALIYEHAGWLESPAKDLSLIKRALKNSHCCFGAFCGSEMVGFFRAISDGVGDAYLLELFVEPPFRRMGIGGKLCDSIVKRLKRDGINWITCISTPEAAGLYSKIGKNMDGHKPFKF